MGGAGKADLLAAKGQGLPPLDEFGSCWFVHLASHDALGEIESIQSATVGGLLNGVIKPARRVCDKGLNACNAKNNPTLPPTFPNTLFHPFVHTIIGAASRKSF